MVSVALTLTQIAPDFNNRESLSLSFALTVIREKAELSGPFFSCSLPKRTPEQSDQSYHETLKTLVYHGICNENRALGLGLSREERLAFTIERSSNCFIQASKDQYEPILAGLKAACESDYQPPRQRYQVPKQTTPPPSVKRRYPIKITAGLTIMAFVGAAGALAGTGYFAAIVTGALTNTPVHALTGLIACAIAAVLCIALGSIPARQCHKRTVFNRATHRHRPVKSHLTVESV